MSSTYYDFNHHCSFLNILIFSGSFNAHQQVLQIVSMHFPTIQNRLRRINHQEISVIKSLEEGRLRQRIKIWRRLMIFFCQDKTATRSNALFLRLTRLRRKKSEEEKYPRTQCLNIWFSFEFPNFIRGLYDLENNLIHSAIFMRSDYLEYIQQ